MLNTIPSLDLALWATTTALTAILLARILLHGLFRHQSLFSIYLAANLFQAIVSALIYYRYGFQSEMAYRVYWTSQALVVAMRALAAAEFCRAILRRYAGLWAFAWRVLASAAAAVSAAALLFGRDGFPFAVIRLEIGCEAFVALFITGTFVFARSYGAAIPRLPALAGGGLAVYSCFKILNDAIVGRYWAGYANLWSHLGTAVFVSILAVWLFAFWRFAAEKTDVAELQPVHVYQARMPEINRRLAELNEQLGQLWNPESQKP